MTMNEYKIETIKITEKYLPAQILGNKKILWSTEPMSISDCKKFISNFNEPKWEWALLEFNV
jgi:hypothetical protein